MKSQEIKLNDNERQKCEIWTRVMGYYRPVENYNVGKRAEYSERTYFKEIVCDNEENTASDNEQSLERRSFKEPHYIETKNTASNNESHIECKCFKESHDVNNESNVLLHNKDNVLEDCTDCSNDININNTTEKEFICDSSIKKAS